MPQSTHTLFCDETGSTGSNFLDPAQPVFAEGGWVVSHERQPKAMAAVWEIESRYKFKLKELKGARLLRRPNGLTMMRQVCQAMAKFATPYLYVVEKRYAVCAKIVETFLDSKYNPNVPNSAAWNPEERQRDADIFYEHGEHLIDEFAEAYREKNAGLVRRNAQRWIVSLNTHGLHDLAGRVAGVLPRIEEEIIDDSTNIDADQTPPGIDSLNFPTIAQVFQFVEQQCPFPCDIVHDQNEEFEPIYKYFFDRFSQARPALLTMKDGRSMRFGFRNALSLSFANSTEHPLIRAADYALAGTRKFIELALADAPIPEDITRISLGGLGSILMNAYAYMHPSLTPLPEIATDMGASKWRGRVFGRLHKELGPILCPRAESR